MGARTSFEFEMNALKADLIDMGHLIEEAIDHSLKAFQEQDHDLAREIIKGDRMINDMERSIEARCLALILRQQPVASDLRVVSTALKVVTDMERIGDQAADIAELLLEMEGEHVFSEAGHIPAMAKACKEMVRDAVKAFAERDLETARQIIERDDYVDALFDKVKQDVVELMKVQVGQTDNGINLLMIAKYLERVADHAVNICEWIEFYETGTVNSVRIL